MSAYTPYDLLRTLVERVGWPQETEKRAALDSIAEWERTGIFGNLVQMLQCEHAFVAADGRCGECRKIINMPSGNRW